jgi:ribosomal protein S18 acetylase RimI-like enzyme
MSGVLVRPAEPADYAAIARLSVAAYRADGQLDAAPHYAAELADVPARARAGELLAAVDETTGEVLGSVLFVLPGTPYAELSGPGEAEFRMLAVDPAAQGRGVGSALVRACLARARELGCHRVVLCTRSFAAAAHRLYARLGFVRTPERDWSPMPGVDLHAFRIDLAAAPEHDPSAARTAQPQPA